MDTPLLSISWPGLILAFVPAALVVAVMYRWVAGAPTVLYATLRMVLQLVAIGYALVYIFEAEHPVLIGAILLVMLTAAAWIALRPLVDRAPRVFLRALAAIAVGGLATLAIVSQLVIDVEPWYSPRYVVPLAGMIFAASMNAVSLAAERFDAERGGGRAYAEARRTALETALIPVINSLFAVGLVSLPGMMTGQILSGVSPLVAVKYQIVVMAMVFGSAGLSAALYLVLARRA